MFVSLIFSTEFVYRSSYVNVGIVNIIDVYIIVNKNRFVNICMK